MRDILGQRMLGSDGCNADISVLAGLREGIIARVKVLSLLLKRPSSVVICLNFMV